MTGILLLALLAAPDADALVREYFDYWETYARTRPSVSAESSALEKLRRPRGHYLAYPPKVYRPARAILEKALKLAREDTLPEYAERVAFLQAPAKTDPLA